jgi:DNA-binding MarR family transcriptional regulator
MDHTRFENSREDIALALEAATALLVRHLAEHRDLSLTSTAVLARLGAEGPVRLTALAEAACVSQPSMTQLVQRLERDGRATRVSDPEDGRATLVGITDAGRELLAELRRGRRSRLAELLTTLSAEDEATLTLAMHAALPILQRLFDNAGRSRASSEAASVGSLQGVRDEVRSDARLVLLPTQEVQHDD